MSSFSPGMVENLMKFTTANREQVEASDLCVCMDCQEYFPSGTVERFLRDGTAFCPSCGNDAVVGDASGLPIFDAGFLDAVNSQWFMPPGR
ncbi:MAG: cytoplasmic protein [Hyphomonadaceae bacterium]